MATTTRRLNLSALCATACLFCPAAIVLLGQAYGFDRLPYDNDFRSWPLYAIDTLFWIDMGFTLGLIWSLRGWRRWFAVFVAIPMLMVTGILAALGGMWVEGTYF